MAKKSLYVTQPYLPPLEEFIPYLERIWDSRILTNGGQFHSQLETALCEYLGVDHISLFANGTLALVTALQSLRITGEVITTPYSFVATAHSLLWNGIRPVFVDIDPKTLNINPALIEAAITPQTTAILAVHCYGVPCDVLEIERIANDYNLRVIYDAAHAFGVQQNGSSILRNGDLSVLSFHATKIFNTFEGGAIISPDQKTRQHINNLKNFGFVNETTVVAAGINGKMSEINAAFGLLQLKHIDFAIAARRRIAERYCVLLSKTKGISIPAGNHGMTTKHAYFPILITNDYPIGRDDLYSKLKDEGIYARRYFFPLISDFPMYRGITSSRHENLPVANSISKSVICLPIYPTLTDDEVDYIASVITGLEK